MRDWLIKLLGGVPNLEYQIALVTNSITERKLKSKEDANEVLWKHISELQDRIGRAESKLHSISDLINGD